MKTSHLLLFNIHCRKPHNRCRNLSAQLHLLCLIKDGSWGLREDTTMDGLGAQAMEKELTVRAFNSQYCVGCCSDKSAHTPPFPLLRGPDGNRYSSGLIARASSTFLHQRTAFALGPWPIIYRGSSADTLQRLEAVHQQLDAPLRTFRARIQLSQYLVIPTVP
ncbi:hypothetical protein L6452_43324 [Arctium lappa]|uniref:Uncharacterized protein n=1 Tax=Arctium lappa TaxID=4217 RepID=A0ACB8XKY7_ARCLA|nr:hypothetical protein L6452_43324 [Arctium lappa]